MKKEQFQKKVYTKLSPFSLGVSPQSFMQGENQTAKKIISTPKRQSTREEFKRTFLPLLIEVFELRQMIKGYTIRSPIEKITKSPKEILKQLQVLQDEIKESQKWCEGIVLQISKAVDEAKAALEGLDPQPPKKWFQKLFAWMKK